MIYPNNDGDAYINFKGQNEQKRCYSLKYALQHQYALHTYVTQHN